MDKKFWLVSLIVLLAIGVFSCKKKAAEKTVRDKQPKKITSSDFTSPSRCGGCHNELFEQWQGSMHENAWRDPVFQKFYKLASEETKGEMDEFCIQCHSPVGYLSYEIPPTDGSKLSDIGKRGVQCDFCHTLSKQLKVGDFQIESAPGTTKRGPFSDSQSPWHETHYSELHTTAEFCGSCHNLNHPDNNLPLEKTYTEWNEGPYKEAGTQCQDCHMTPGPQVNKPNPGKAASMGPEREHIFTHEVVGGNAALTGWFGSERHKKLVTERLGEVISLKLVSPQLLSPGEKGTVSIKVVNTGCGHYFPTGLTELRQAWLEVEVTDDNDELVFDSGKVDNKGNIDKSAHIFNTIILDKDGEQTDKIWLAEKIKRDRRIPPKGSLRENYTIEVPEDAEAPFSVEVTLKYRSMPQSLADELFGEGKFEVPIIEMAHLKAFN